MKFKTEKKGLEVALYVFLAVCLFYYSYRYAFRYNSESTSPTYHDTPTFIKVLKYILFLMIIVWMFVKRRGKLSVQKKNKFAFIICLLQLFQLAMLGVIFREINSIQIAIMLLFLLFFIGKGNKIELLVVEKILVAFWYFSLAYEVLQLLLWKFYGRLPALGYESTNIMDVRFGGALDDPNGYAMILIFYTYYFCFSYNSLKRIVFIAINLVMLFLTGSGTGVLSLLVSVPVMIIVLTQERKMLRRALITISVFLFAGIMVFIRFKPFIVSQFERYLRIKSASAQGHMSGWDLSDVSWMTIFGFYSNNTGSEVGYIRLLTLGGIPALVAFFIISCLGVFKIYKMVKKTTGADKRIAIGLLAYSISFLLGMFNISLMIVVPCMGMYICCLAIAFSYDTNFSPQQMNSITDG